jgi:hypothetical protein
MLAYHGHGQMVKVSVCMFECRGFQRSGKRSLIFEWAKKMKDSIVMFTHGDIASFVIFFSCKQRNPKFSLTFEEDDANLLK